MPVYVPHTEPVRVTGDDRSIFRIGNSSGASIIATSSNDPRRAWTVGHDYHIIELGTQEGLTWIERSFVTASELLQVFETQWQLNPEKMLKIVWQICPKLKGIPTDNLEYQVVGSSPGAAGREDIHAYIYLRERRPRLVP